MSHAITLNTVFKDLETLRRAAPRCQAEVSADGRQLVCGSTRIGLRQGEDGIDIDIDSDYYNWAFGPLGPKLGLLKQAYAVEAAKLAARRKGWSVRESQAGSRIKLVVTGMA